MTSCFHNHDLTQPSSLLWVFYYENQNIMGKESLKILSHMFLEMGRQKEICTVAFEYP